MNALSSLCIPETPNKVLIGMFGALAITGIALAIIGLTASLQGPFHHLVQNGTTFNGIVLGVSAFVLVIDLIWIGILYKKRNLVSPIPLNYSAKVSTPGDAYALGVNHGNRAANTN